jgi:hypothetical protein
MVSLTITPLLPLEPPIRASLHAVFDTQTLLMSKKLLFPFHTALELEKCPNHLKKAAKDVTVEAVEEGNKPAAAASGVAAFGASASVVHVVKIDEEGALGAAMDAMDKEYVAWKWGVRLSTPNQML